MTHTGNIVVTGTTGSGKTTLARAIAAQTGRVHLDLDDFHWLPGWQARKPDDFLVQIAAAIAAVPAGQYWVVSGNYSETQPVVWARAQTLVVLEYSSWRIFWQLLCRTLHRCWSQQPVCNGNTETFDKAFFSKDSILLWFFKSHWRRKRKLAALIANPGPYAHLRIVRLTSPDKTRQWLTTLT